ncbi:DUF3300 domain-containing protein [Ensifer sp. LC163]|uniref:DUF3300 domain-containing protein n=1 Tax=Ensifer sp. LC163 TaxID=1120652 RepID=UPI0009F37A0E|nr:DUF3300 domain-containing protein [Ensifer sp. LC163]
MAVLSVIRLHRSICFLATACLLIPEPYTYNFRAFAQEQAAADPSAAQQDDADRPAPLSEDELEVLVARIALYPDELVALIASASLFPLQIVEAERYLENLKKNKDLKPKDSWDGSVISLLNYPELVMMMSEDLDWTQSLSDAMAYQQKDVLIAIQQLRDKAVASGVLKTDDKMKVVQENDNVIIQAANPEKIYVPQYEPEMLYVPDYAPEPLSYYPEPYPSYYYPAATFFAGAVTGAVFGAIVDWDDWGVWGGRFDGDIDVDCNRCFNDIDITGKVKFNDIDWKNVDRSKINIDKSQFAKLDRTNMKNRLEANGHNNIRDKAKITRSNASASLRQKVDTGSFKDLKDVRANKIDGAKNRAAAARPNAGAANRQAGAAAAAKRAGNVSKPGAGSGGKINRPASKPRPAGKVDNRPRKPSGLGEVRSGKATQIQSRRGGQALGGGARSGRPPHRSISHGGGGGRSMARHGGGGGARHGGGGRGGGGRRR